MTASSLPGRQRNGKVVTFYSYKGGTGRTMALANVAWILASAGKRVLVADWDLEAPGLHRFFAPFLQIGPVAKLPGVIDMVRAYEEYMVDTEQVNRSEAALRNLASVDQYIVPIEWGFPGGGELNLLTAGRQNVNYAASVGARDWDTFYVKLGGAEFLDALRIDMRDHYDYTLIDSRTGLSDVADICTLHLPDVLVDCYTLSDQGIDGAVQVAQAVTMLSKRGGPDHVVRILPVAMRVDPGEKEKASAGRALALRKFTGLPTGMSDDDRARYFADVEVPYQTFYAYEETLATFFDDPAGHGGLLAAYQRLTGFITDGKVSSMPTIVNPERERWQRRFKRSLSVQQNPSRIRYAAADQLWAEWALTVLDLNDIAVADEGPLEISDEWTPDSDPVLTVVSTNYLAMRPSSDGADPWLREPHLLLVVDDARLPLRQSAMRVSVAKVSAGTAERRLLSLVEPAPGASPRLSTDEPVTRFPGTEPRWFRAPARNDLFTGRVDDLQRLRRQLQAGRQAVVVQRAAVALHGLGGVGKTQVAMEYVYRFQSDYDLVWWIDADPPQFIDTQLIDLGAKLNLVTPGTTVKAAQATLDALNAGAMSKRWLLVYDNAEEPAAVKDLIPKGGPGHVLITSRDREWEKLAQAVPVDVFQRSESVAHLRSRTEALTREQADQVADALGDLPIAVAAAGAWLADTGVPVADYLKILHNRPAHTRVPGGPPVEATWDLSLKRLRDQSPGGHRLLQICSVMGSDIALDLLYSDALMSAVALVDPAAAEPEMRATLVNSISRLALLKHDRQARQVQVHRLLQEVVRSRMTEHERAQTKHEVHLALAGFRPSGDPDDPATWERFRMIWRHLRISEAEYCNDPAARALVVDRVRYLWQRGDLAPGLQLGERVATEWASLLARIESPGDEPPITDVAAEPLRRQLLLLRFNIANILREQADFEGALKLDAQVLAEQRALLGDEHANTLRTMGSYAADLRALGRYREALPMEQDTNRAWRAGFGESHRRTLASANNLAAALRAVGDFTAALAIDEDVFEQRRSLLGPANPYTLRSQAALGRDLREAGEYQQSVELLRTVLELSSHHLGDDDLVTLNAQVNLAASLRSAGEAKEAAELLESAYGALRHRFGPGNPSTLACRLTRSSNLLTQGEAQKALTEMRAVAEAYRTTLGDDHPFSLVCANNQVAALQSNGATADALTLAQFAAQKCAEQLGKKHPHYLAAAMNGAACRFDLGDADGAATAMREAAELMESALGPNHPDFLLCRANLAVVAAAHTASSSADPDLAAAVSALQDRIGATHPSVRELRSGRVVYRTTDAQDPF